MLFRSQGDLREVFPLKKPHFSGIAGTILIWVGTFLCEMVLLLILSLFFPEQILEVNDGLSSSIAAGPFLLSFVTVAISPAICEEVLFRGTFVSSLRGRLGKWAVLLIRLHFWDVPRRCFSIFSDSDRWGDDGISVVGNRKYVL